MERYLIATIYGGRGVGVGYLFVVKQLFPQICFEFTCDCSGEEHRNNINLPRPHVCSNIDTIKFTIQKKSGDG